MEKIKHKPYGPYEKYIKRPLDLICSLIAIIVFSWLYLIIAILVRVKLGSPVIFTQDRPGKDEKIFKLYKFRTMMKAEIYCRIVKGLPNLEKYLEQLA